MRILISNDDGIWAPGIRALVEALSSLGEIFIVAPDRERSATGHGITVHWPLKVDKVDFGISGVKAWAVEGTPADCVKLGIEVLTGDKRPDVVVSGINNGPNLGTDILYSGTVSAAIEAIINEVPGIAVSLASYHPNDFSVTGRIAALMVEKLLENGISEDTILNVNVPALAFEEIKGIKVTRLGQRRYQNAFHERRDPRGRIYYWIGGEPIDLDASQDTDIWAIESGYVSVTPVHFDLTNYKIMQEVDNWKLSL